MTNTEAVTPERKSTECRPSRPKSSVQAEKKASSHGTESGLPLRPVAFGTGGAFEDNAQVARPRFRLRAGYCGHNPINNKSDEQRIADSSIPLLNRREFPSSRNFQNYRLRVKVLCS